MLDIIYIIIGVCIVLFGADRLTDGAVNIARRLNMPEIVIGLTIVAIGTSMPEFFVSLMSALKGTSDMAIGNIVGSNLFNTLLITGVAACVASMQIGHATVRKDIPFAAAATPLLVTLADACFFSISSASGCLYTLLQSSFIIYNWQHNLTMANIYNKKITKENLVKAINNDIDNIRIFIIFQNLLISVKSFNRDALRLSSAFFFPFLSKEVNMQKSITAFKHNVRPMI